MIVSRWWSMVLGFISAIMVVLSPLFCKSSEAFGPTTVVPIPSLSSRIQLEAAAAAAGKPEASTHLRVAPRRWNGNYKHAKTKLCEVPKSKKLQLSLSVRHVNGTIATQIVEKKRQETLQHVLTKAIIWKLYCDEYPNMQIEKDIGDPNYLPDVISLPSVDDDDTKTNNPLLWGESGRMKVHKAMDLMQRYPDTHIVHCRWDMDLDAIAGPLEEHLQELMDTDDSWDEDLKHRPGRFTVCSLPLDVWRFIDEETGMIHISLDDLECRDIQFPTSKTSDSSNLSAARD